MRTKLIILASVFLLGQIISLIGLFKAETNDGLLMSMWSFLIFTIFATIVLLIDKKERTTI
jgi:hypothetical protein